MSNLEKLLDGFGNHAQIASGVEMAKEGILPDERFPLYFGCNSKDIPTVCIQWSQKGRGFGEYTFQLINGKMVLDAEGDSKETVKEILCMMIDQCEIMGEEN